LKDKENSNGLNSHFVSIADKVTSHLQNSTGCTTNSQYINDLFILTPTNSDEVKEVVFSLKNTLASGVDKIKLNTIKYCIDEISEYITEIINLSFSQNKVPKGMKIGKIIPIFKGGSPTDPSNYRPISILPIISKILEKIVQIRLLTFFQLRFQVFAQQYGFIQNSNTITALFDLISKIQTSLDSKLKTSGLFLDLAKAFDVVDHEFLLTKLLKLGIRDN
jgi:Reverse transcriptase (RNA-dependent DNA polymerase)